MKWLTALEFHAHSITGRICLSATILMILGLSLVVTGLVQHQSLMSVIGIGLFLVAALPMLVIMLATCYAGRKT